MLAIPAAEENTIEYVFKTEPATLTAHILLQETPRTIGSWAKVMFRTRHSMSCYVAGYCLLVWIPTVAAASAEPSFMGLGDLPGGENASRAYGISPDGNTIVGQAGASPYPAAFAWTQSEGIRPLTSLPSDAQDASFEGSVITGSVFIGGWQPFRWTAQSGLVPLGDLPGGLRDSHATAVSANGETIVGYSRSETSPTSLEAFRWTGNGGMQRINTSSGALYATLASNVSADGSIIVGSAYSLGGAKAFRWTEADGLTALAGFPDGLISCNVYAMSLDGQTYVGNYGLSTGQTKAFRWSENNGLVQLIPDSQGVVVSSARAVSGDGSIIVGQISGRSNDGAMIWDSTHGARFLSDVLRYDYNLDLTGWLLRDAASISADGSTIVGLGINPSGRLEAYRAVIPEPAGWGFALAAALLGNCRRRRLVRPTRL